MGTRSNLYAGQPGTTATTLVTSATGKVTTITYAQATNTGNAPVTLNAIMSGVEVTRNLTVPARDSVTIFGVPGGSLNAAQTLVVTLSDATVDVKIDGYEADE